MGQYRRNDDAHPEFLVSGRWGSHNLRPALLRSSEYLGISSSPVEEPSNGIEFHSRFEITFPRHRLGVDAALDVRPLTNGMRRPRGGLHSHNNDTLGVIVRKLDRLNLRSDGPVDRLIGLRDHRLHRLLYRNTNWRQDRMSWAIVIFGNPNEDESTFRIRHRRDGLL